MFKRLLLCYDGTDHGRRALKRGAELAIFLGANVHVLAIVKPEAPSPVVSAAAVGFACLVDEEQSRQAVLDASVGQLRGAGVAAEGYLAHGHTIDEIVVYSQKLAVDLIVIGNYPSTPVRRWWSGPARASLAERVSCCILVAANPSSDSDGVVNA
jgi:nucleotide-binding universal stress UspA family protein